MNAIEDTPSSRAWTALAQTLPRPKAILVVSAHWVTPGSRTVGVERPKTIHDFYGFPRELFAQQYPAPGAPELAAQVVGELAERYHAAVDLEWGLDHGAWSLLKFLFPKADVPVFQLSLNQNLRIEEHLELGRELRHWRDQGVLILASGNIVHNLRRVQWDGGADAAFATDFRQRVVSGVEDSFKVPHQSVIQQYAPLFERMSADPHLFREAHPTIEHLLPLMYTLGGAFADDQLQVVADVMDLGSIAMTGFLFKSSESK